MTKWLALVAVVFAFTISGCQREAGPGTGRPGAVEPPPPPFQPGAPPPMDAPGPAPKL